MANTRTNMKKAAIGLLACSLTITTFSVRADWQYTRWGMSRGDVEAAVAAAGKQVMPPFQPADQQKGGAAVFEFRAPYDAGGVPFSAMFGFDRATGKLSEVTLVPSQDRSCKTIRSALVERYGAPEFVNEQSPGRSMRVVDDQWRDAQGQNLVKLSTIIALGNEHCSVSYRPLVSAGKSGF